MKKALTLFLSCTLLFGSTQTLSIEDAIIKNHNTQTIVNQAGYTLLGLLSDTDADGYLEAPDISSKSTDGGFLPSSLPAPVQ